MKIWILLTGLLVALTAQARPARPLALVYRGPGACNGCPEAAAKIARLAGLRVRYISPGRITPELLSRASVYIQGGGDEQTQIKAALSRDEFEALRTYVREGGHYWGICNGAYFAGHFLDPMEKVEGLDIVPAMADPHSSTREARMELVTWKGQKRWMYFQDGPEFRIDPGADVEIIARYADGSVAAFHSRYGKGSVSLSGPHPEADESWWEDDHLADPDGLDTDLGVDMLRELVGLD